VEAGFMDWNAISTAGVFFATVGLILVAWLQTTSIRRDNKLERTLHAWAKYESDPVIAQCARSLRAARASGDYEKSPNTYTHDIVIMLNYLDNLAIGIEEGLYEENLAGDHMRSILNFYTKQYLNKDTFRIHKELKIEDYSSLNRLRERWARRD
jgi:hypothetical protein